MTSDTQTISPTRDWSGISGTRWAEQIDLYEPMLEAVGAGLLDHAAFRPGERIVEIGCGGGGLARRIAAAVAPTGTVLGLDISPALVALARNRAVGIGNLSVEEADAQIMRPYAAPFDRLVSRFGVMFFADPAAAMRNMHAMLTPGGRLDFAVWGAPADNPALSTTSRIARAHLGLAPPDPNGPSPFAFADVAYVRGLLEHAGFAALDFTSWRGEVFVGKPGDDAGEVARLLMSTGSLVDSIVEAGDTIRAAIHSELTGAIAAYVTPNGGVFPAAVHFITARA